MEINEIEMRKWCVKRAISAGATADNIKEISEKLYSFLNPVSVTENVPKQDNVVRSKAGFVDEIPRSQHMSYEWAKVLRECIRMDLASEKINQQLISKKLNIAPVYLVRILDGLIEKKYLERIENSRTIKILMNPLSEPYTCQQMFITNKRGPHKKTNGHVEYNGPEKGSYQLKKVATVSGPLLSERKKLMIEGRDLGISEGAMDHKSAQALKTMIQKRRNLLSLKSPEPQYAAAE